MVITVCGGYFGSGSLGLGLCLCTGWRDEHLPRAAAWLHVSAWLGSRLAGRSNQHSHGRPRARNVGREPADIRHVAHESATSTGTTCGASSAGMSAGLRFSDVGDVRHRNGGLRRRRYTGSASGTSAMSGGSWRDPAPTPRPVRDRVELVCRSCWRSVGSYRDGRRGPPSVALTTNPLAPLRR